MALEKNSFWSGLKLQKMNSVPLFKPVLSSNLINLTLEESEFEERHGLQYHLRHHLSGCAQSLYSVDLTEVMLSAPQNVKNEYASLPLDSPAIKTHVQSDSYKLTMDTHNQFSSQPNDSASLNISTNIHPHFNPSATTKALLDANLTLLSSVPKPVTMLASNQTDLNALIPIDEMQPSEHSLSRTVENTPNHFIAEGWQTNVSLDDESNGNSEKFFIKSHNISAGEPILWHDFAMAEGEIWQFEMEVESNNVASLPQFKMEINGETTSLTLIKGNGNYFLRGEYVSSSAQTSHVVIMPIENSGHDVSLSFSKIAFQPMMPYIALSVEYHEPVFYFSKIIPEQLSMTAPTQVSNINSSMLLENAEPALLTDEHSSQHIDKLPSILLPATTFDWNQIEIEPVEPNVSYLPVTMDIFSHIEAYTLHI